MSGPHETPQDQPWSEDEQALLRQAIPEVPQGLAGRVLDAVREAALRKIRFRLELERSARASLIAAAAGLLACAALVLDGSGSDSSVARSPGATSPRVTTSVAAPDSSSGEPLLAELESAEQVDDAQALSFSSPPGVLESELTSGLWLFAETEGE